MFYQWIQIPGDGWMVARFEESGDRFCLPGDELGYVILERDGQGGAKVGCYGSRMFIRFGDMLVTPQ